MRSSKKVDPYLNANQEMVDELYDKAMRWYQVSLWSYIGYLAFFVLLQLLAEFDIKKLAMQCLPLLIFLPGVLQKHHKTFSWICFVTLLYFTAYVVEIGSPLFHWSDVIGLSFSIVLFIAAMMTSRWLQHWRYARFRYDQTRQAAPNTNS